MDTNEWSYILNELGESREHYFNAVAPPIIQTSNFVFDSVDDMRQRFKDEYGGLIYSRGRNPTVDILAQKLAALECAEDALVFNSGAAAIFSSVVPFVSKGDHIVSVRNPYSWAQKLFDHFLPRFGVVTEYVDGRDPDHFRKAMKANTRLFYLESPNSWDFAIQDIQAITQLAKEHEVLTVLDNSYCSPYYQQPIRMGVDLVLHSATKYLSGHSDVVAGVVCGSQRHIRKIFELEYLMAGNGIQPFNAWLLMRGLRTLPSRLDRITKTSFEVLDYLKQHERVEKVLFPLDEGFPQYQLAKSQMKGACGLMSFVMRAEQVQEIEQFCNQLKHILKAVSWGGYESLIIPKAAGMEREAFDASDENHRLVRLYVGLEDAHYLIADLEQAFRSLA